jgi:hypothetical protein
MDDIHFLRGLSNAGKPHENHGLPDNLVSELLIPCLVGT